MFKRLFYLLAASFTFIASISATSASLNEGVSSASRISLTAVEGTTASEFPDYGPDKLVDNNFDNTHKWYTRPGTNVYAIFSTTTAVRVSKFVVYNGNDSSSFSSRVWASWSIYASKTKLDRSSSNWVNIYTSTSSMPTSGCTSRSSANTNNSKECVSTDTTNTYQYFKVECSSHTSTDMQMGELDLYGVVSNSITYKDGDTTITGLTPTTYDVGVGVATLPNAPEKEGMSFIGWYDAKSDGNKVTSISTTDTGDKVLYARYLSNITGKGLGGYKKSGSKKTQIVTFGFTFNDYAYLTDTDSFGVFIYSDSTSSTPIKTFSSTSISELKTKEGRYYCVFDCSSEGQTYYAKGYLSYNGTYLYSDIYSATGNFNQEYSE